VKVHELQQPVQRGGWRLPTAAQSRPQLQHKDAPPPHQEQEGDVVIHPADYSIFEAENLTPSLILIPYAPFSPLFPPSAYFLPFFFNIFLFFHNFLLHLAFNARDCPKIL
jgi:hypothetical protein